MFRTYEREFVCGSLRQPGMADKLSCPGTSWSFRVGSLRRHRDRLRTDTTNTWTIRMKGFPAGRHWRHRGKTTSERINPSPDSIAQSPNPNPHLPISLSTYVTTVVPTTCPAAIAIATSVKYLALSSSEPSWSAPIDDTLGMAEPEVTAVK